MKTKHTKGKWIVSDTDFNTDHHGGGYSVNVDSDDGWCIATIEDVDDDERLPNAKLIAAAPAMLEALIEITQERGRYDSNTIEDMIQIAQAAIKKATE